MQNTYPSTQQIVYLKDYFFCLVHAYEDELAKKIKENDISSGVLFDIGNIGNYAFVLDSLVIEKVKLIESS